MSQIHRSITAVLLAATLAGCTAWPAPPCRKGLQPITEAHVFFGRAIATGGTVSDDDWRRFVDEEVTPRFPDGLSVVDASGQWKAPTGILREPSKVLIVVLTGQADRQRRLDAVRDAYRRRFRQDSVLLVETAACGSF